MNFKTWVEEHDLLLEFHEEFNFLFYIEGLGKFLLVDTNVKKTFDENFKLILNDEESSWVEEVDYYCFKFGSRFYYSSTKKEEISLNIFRFLGKSKNINNSNFPYLGIHGCYEVANGMHSYEKWIDYAKFIGVDTIGICEKNTLGGTMSFQNAAKKGNISSVLGSTYKIKLDEDLFFYVKCYVTSDIGWKNILNLNASCNVFNSGFIPFDTLLEKNEDLILVIDQSNSVDESFIDILNQTYKNRLFFQFDPCEYVYSSKEEVHLKRLKYIFNHPTIPSVLIPDMHYIEKTEAATKKLMNDVARLSVHQSNDQYFKPLSVLKKNFDSLFSEKNKQNSEIFWNEIVQNAITISEKCKKFKIRTDKLYLPEFPLTAEQKEKYGTKENYLYSLIETYFDEKVVNKNKDVDFYSKRLNYELDVIEKGDMVNYFLILNDAVEECNRRDIQMGFGRGSGAGSLLNYLLGITNVDPIPYDLLFERFLNPARVGLEETETTFITNQESDNCIIITDENNVEYKLSLDSIVRIEREGVRLTVPVNEIKETDSLLLAI